MTGIRCWRVLLIAVAVLAGASSALATHNPHLGRFMQRDSAGYRDGMNAHAYEAGSPVTHVDPSGRTVSVSCHARRQIMRGLKNINVHGYVLKRQGDMDEYSGQKTLFRRNGDYSEIAGSMIKSKRVFKIKGDTAKEAILNWKKHVDARRNIVAAAKSVAFDFNVNETWNQQHWRGASTVPRARSNAYDAVTDIWAKPGRYEMACLRATASVIAKGIATTLGKADFNKAWGGPGKSLTGLWSNKSLTRWYYKVESSDWIPGDWGYVDDPRANPPAGQEGENIVYVGNKKYWGHPSQTKTLDEWRAKVGGWSGTPAKEIKVFTWRIGPVAGIK